MPLLLAAFLFAMGGRKKRGLSDFQAGCFWSGWLVLAVALISPLHRLSEVLFSAHMMQHELLILGAAPLLVLSRPLAPMLWGLPMPWRRTLGQWAKQRGIRIAWKGVTRPLAAWLIHAAALWIWHIPAFFDATLQSDAIHAAQHVSFFGSALLFWWSLFYAHGRLGYGAGVIYIFTTAVHTSILGALLTFAHTAWYPVYRQTLFWGFTALEDQQIGGLIMWVPASIVYLAAALTLFALWLREGDVLADRKVYA